MIEATRVLTREQALDRWRDKPVNDLIPASALVSEAVCAVSLDSVPILLQARLQPVLVNGLRHALRAFPITQTVLRSKGIESRAQTFGYLARAPLLRRNSCRISPIAARAPAEHAWLCGLASWLAFLLQEYLPEQYAANLAAASVVHEDWRLPGDLWTSGIVNLTTELPYHMDRNNLKAWSAMPVIRRGTRGGHLHLPELEIDGEPLVLPCRDGDVIFFNGQDLMHGVTPIKRVMKDGYRYSVVYYPVANMRHGLPREQELAATQTRRTELEATMLERQRASGHLGGTE